MRVVQRSRRSRPGVATLADDTEDSSQTSSAGAEAKVRLHSPQRFYDPWTAVGVPLFQNVQSEDVAQYSRHGPAVARKAAGSKPTGLSVEESDEDSAVKASSQDSDSEYQVQDNVSTSPCTSQYMCQHSRRQHWPKLAVCATSIVWAYTPAPTGST